MNQSLDVEHALQLVEREFKRRGLVLESDRRLPSIVTLVAGEAVRGSWWNHPKGRTIWHVLKLFVARRDVLGTRLVSGKVTFVDRRLWPEFLAVSTSREGWQTGSLSPQSHALLKLVDRRREIRTDDAQFDVRKRRSIADAARELESRLLVFSEEVHTSRGFHAKVLRSWKRWSAEVGFDASLPSVPAAKARFEALIAALNQEKNAEGSLPWAAKA